MSKFKLAGLGLALVCLLTTLNVQASPMQKSGALSDTGSLATTIFLPLVYQPDQFAQQSRPIWLHQQIPMEHEVVLFRRSFPLDAPVENVELAIFADTRYQVWLDGYWLGSGPARFLDDDREYDRYAVGNLTVGEHLLAVLVQWAPNIRRSESLTPLLRVAMNGYSDDAPVELLASDQTWRTQRASAWQTQSVPVHRWGLIGPTELLDLRALPPDWMQPGYDVSDWQPAVLRAESDWSLAWHWDPAVMTFRAPYIQLSTKEQPRFAQSSYPVSQGAPVTTVRYSVRSIDLLEQVPIPVVVIDQGVLSPGHWILEVPFQADPVTLPFRVSQDQELVFEGLSGVASTPPHNIHLDGNSLNWVSSGRHPDVWQALLNVTAGSHALAFDDIPAEGITLAVPRAGVTWDEIPFSQGLHAGRRLLLAEYHSSIAGDETTSALRLPVTLDPLPGYVLIDLGRSIHGRLQATISGPAGSIVDIGWDERLWDGENIPLPFPGSLHPEWNQVDSWILDGDERVLTTLDARSGRYILIAFWGPGPVSITDLVAHEERYPVGNPASFSSSDELLDQIWQVGVETLYPNLTDALTDTPWRERGQWWGDAYVSAHAGRVIFGDQDLLRRGLYLMGQSFVDGQPVGMAPNGAGLHMLDYGMLWLHAL
ncbi:MAG: hypothetical protein JW862_12625, partial [Anaerolineales bacterium]|nr:hypothetical protein [Anaerolineales bacterium]